MNVVQLKHWYVDEGLSAAAIGKILGLSGGTVISRLRDNRIPIRNPGPPKGKNNPSWKGGRILDTFGYILLRMPDHPDANATGYVREHRYVMEQTLGRRLEKDEIVHHRNHNKMDNRPMNLELVAPGEHRTIHQSSPLPPPDVLENWYVVQKMTLQEIAKVVGCHYGTVAARLRAHGVQIRKSNDLRMVWFSDRLVEEYQTQSLRKLAKTYRCSVAAVHDELVRRGCPLRRSGRLRDSHSNLLPPEQSSSPARSEHDAEGSS